MSDPESAAATLTRLRSLGIQVGIDDFGTGYSSLNYLRRFPIDTLKIDRSFVQRMSSDVKDLEIVQTILTLAHNLAMDVVAEGVETIQQRDQLQTLGCELGQGFLFLPGRGGPDAEALLASSLDGRAGPRMGRAGREASPEAASGDERMGPSSGGLRPMRIVGPGGRDPTAPSRISRCSPLESGHGRSPPHRPSSGRSDLRRH